MMKGLSPEVVMWAFEAQHQMLTISKQMKTAQTEGNKLLYYKLKNEAILKRIEFQRGMIERSKKDTFSILNHDKITELALQLDPFKEHAEARRQYENSQFDNNQVQEIIDNDFTQADNLLNRIGDQLDKLMQFKQEHTKVLNEEAVLYEMSDQTRCHGPECQATQFTKSLQKCARCKKVLYCGAECQKKDWPAHKKGCTKAEQSEAS